VTDDGYELLRSTDSATEPAGSASGDPQEPVTDILSGDAKRAVFAYVAEQDTTTRDELYQALDGFDNRGLAATLRFLAQDAVVETTDDTIQLTDEGYRLRETVADELDPVDPTTADTGNTDTDSQDNRAIIRDYIAEHGEVTKNELRVNLELGNRVIGQNLRHLREDGAIVEPRADTYQPADTDTGKPPATGGTEETDDTGGPELLRDRSVEEIMDGRMITYIERRKTQLDDKQGHPEQQQDDGTDRVQAVREEKQQIMTEEDDDPLLAQDGQSAMEQDQTVRERTGDERQSGARQAGDTGRGQALHDAFADEYFRDDDGNPYQETIEGEWRHDDGFADRDFTGETDARVPGQRLAALTGISAETIEAAYRRGLNREGNHSLIEGWDLPEKKEALNVDLTQDTAGYEGFM
jgi:DNA-binding HxlR family transcriptional regulator